MQPYINVSSVSKAFYVQGLTPIERLVFLYLSRHDGAPSPETAKKLAEIIGVTDKTIRRAMQSLEDKGLITAPLGKYGGRGKGTMYDLTFPRWIEQLHEQPLTMKPRSRANLRVVRLEKFG